jgi:hypothetical protein
MTSTLPTYTAPAMTYRQERAAERRTDKALDAELRRADLAAAAERRRAAEAAAAQLAAARRQERRDRRAALVGRLPELGMSVLWATMMTLPLILVWDPQVSFARDFLHIPADRAWLFPAVIETGAWLCALEGHRRGRRGDSAGSLPRWMWTLSGIAAGTNVLHGIADGSAVTAAGLGVLSLLGVLLHSIRQGLDAVESGARVRRSLGLAVWRRVRYPRLSIAAASIRAARGLDPAAAWTLAWEDRFGVGPDSTRRERRIGRLVVKRNRKLDRERATDGGFMIVNGGVQPVFADQVRELIDAERRAAIERADREVRAAQEAAHDVLMAAGMVFGPDALAGGSLAPNTEDTTAEQGGLGGRAAALLPDLRAAIAAGDVPANPSVRAITRWVKDRGESLGVPVAQELRDAVRVEHLPFTTAGHTDAA